ncbi:hypothetical protein Hanom_Chr02g00102351 [Helianthus anomalus]
MDHLTGGNNVNNTLGFLCQVNYLLGNASDDTRTRVIRKYTFDHFFILELDYLPKPSSLYHFRLSIAQVSQGELRRLRPTLSTWAVVWLPVFTINRGQQ